MSNKYGVGLFKVSDYWSVRQLRDRTMDFLYNGFISRLVPLISGFAIYCLVKLICNYSKMPMIQHLKKILEINL